MIPALAFLCAVGLSLVLTPLVRRAALRMGIVDQPGGRKIHHVPIPLLGGAAIVLSFTVVMLGLRFLAPSLLGENIDRVFPLLAAGALVGALGVWDDWKGAKASVKLVWQVVAASILVFAGAEAELFTNPLGGSFHIGWLGIPITIVWIVGVTNALNLIDGLDGLAAGIGCIAALSLCAVGASTDSTLVALASLSLAGAALGFLPYNMSPARIFLGDTGSMFIGFILASLGAVGSVKASTTTLLVLPIVVLGIPVFDTIWAVLRRTRRRVSPFKPDRDHVHHRLVRVGLHHRHVTLVFYFICAFLGLSAVIMVNLPTQTGLLFAVLLAMGGALGLWTLKFIEDHVEERLASVGEAEGAAPPAGSSGGKQGRSGAWARKSDPPGVHVAVCRVGKFKPGVVMSPSFGKVTERIGEALSSRLRVYEVGAFMEEERTLMVVLRIQALGDEGRRLVEAAITGIFAEEAGRWGDGNEFPRFRWVSLREEKSRNRGIRVPGAAIL